MLRMSDPFSITGRKDVLEQAFKWMSAARNTHWVQFEIKLPLIPSCTAFVAVVTWLLKRDTGARVLLRDNPSSERGFRLNVPVKNSVFQLTWWMAYCILYAVPGLGAGGREESRSTRQPWLQSQQCICSLFSQSSLAGISGAIFSLTATLPHATTLGNCIIYQIIFISIRHLCSCLSPFK